MPSGVEAGFARASTGRPVGPNIEECCDPCMHSHGMVPSDGSGRSPSHTSGDWAANASTACSRSETWASITGSSADPTSQGRGATSSVRNAASSRWRLGVELVGCLVVRSGAWYACRMAARHRMRAYASALGAAAMFAATACNGPAEEATAQGDSAPPNTQAAVAVALELCEDIPEFESSVMGNLEGVLDQVREPDPWYRAAIRRYGREHAATSGGQWTDPDRGNVIVATFTDDAETHRAAIAALVPSSAKFDVVQVNFSDGELLAMHRLLGGFMGPEYGLTGVGLGTKRNRVRLVFTDPPPGSLAEFALLAPTDMVCAEIFRSAEPPSGPLAVIPDLTRDDPMVVCGRFGPMPFSRFVDPPRLDEVDHPAVERLRAALDSPAGRLLPAGDYRVMDIGTEVVSFGAFSDEGIARLTVIYGAGRWRIGRWSRDAYSCDVRVALPAGLAPVEIHLDPGIDPGSLPQPGDTSIDLLATEMDCANGRNMGDALQGPQVIETDYEVLVAFAVIPVAGGANCPGNPSTRVTIELSRPLGERVLLDGTHIPPQPIEAEHVTPSSAAEPPTRNTGTDAGAWRGPPAESDPRLHTVTPGSEICVDTYGCDR